jgi:hypothetical protein
MSKKIELALEVLGEAMQEDESYYYRWRDNISMSFQDVFKSCGLGLVDLQKMSNEAAERFLKALFR